MFGSALLLGGVLAAFAAVPVLIHLINMMRHRRVKWAAMDFLLQSYKKHRNWVWLKQLLLLLARMATMVLVAVMLCVFVQGLLNDLRKSMGWDEGALSKLLGGKTTHHYVLVDDSYSMSERAGQMTVFDRADRVVQDVARRVSGFQSQRLTLIRFSQARRGSGQDASGDVAQIADLNAVEIDKELKELDERRNVFQVSQHAIGALPAIQLVRQLIQQRTEEIPVVYIVSDYRAKDWDNPAEITQALESIKQQPDADIQLINCVKQFQQNLAITDLSADSDIRAAGVPMFVNVRVKNFGAEKASNVQVEVRTNSFDASQEVGGDPKQAVGQIEQLPTVLFSEIMPGETATRPVQVYFPKPGKHVVEATLEEDAVAVDNVRRCVVEVLDGVPVLIIDRDVAKRNAYYLSSAFAPGRKSTGIRPQIESVNFLRDETLDALSKFQTVYLLDVDRLDERAVENIEQYVRRGGTLVTYVGPNVDMTFYNNTLYRDGQGILPVAFGQEVELEPQDKDRTPDIVATDHPVFAAFMGERNSFFGSVTIQRYVKPTLEWTARQDADLQIVAALRNGDPLAVERRVGEGRVISFLTTLAPDWHNWTRNPTFVVVSLKLQAYLSTATRKETPLHVGSPIQVKLAADKYRKELSFVVRANEAEEPLEIEKTAEKEDESSDDLTAPLGIDMKEKRPNGETDKAAIYEAWTRMIDGIVDVRRFAVNVDADEGDLSLVDDKLLLTKFEQLKPKYLHWDEINPDQAQQAGFNLSKWILLVLIGILVIEQFLAYVCSYHPLRRGARS